MNVVFFTKNLYLYFFLLLFIIIPDDKNLTIVVLGIGSLVSICYILIYRGSLLREMIENRYLYAILAFLVPVALSMIDTLYPERRYYVFITLLQYLLIGVLPIIFLNMETNFRKLEVLVFLGVIFIALDAILQWQFGYHILGYNPAEDTGAGIRVYGIFGDLAHLSYFLGTLSPVVFFVIYRQLEEKTTIFRVLIAILIFSLIVTGVMIGGARAGMISFTVSLFLFLIYVFFRGSFKHKFRILALIIFILVISLVLLSQTNVVQDRFSNTTSEFGTLDFYNQFTSYRANLWYVGFKEIPNYWINGAGTRAFNEVYQTYPESFKIFGYTWHPHLQGLEVLLLTGIIGFIPYILLCIYLLRQMFIARAGNMWLMVTFIALMPINTHVGIYQNFWLPMIWIPMMLGLSLAHKKGNE